MPSLDVSLDKGHYLPGEQVRATVRVQADTGLAIRQGLARLQYRNEFLVSTSGVQTVGGSLWHTVEVATEPFATGETIPAGGVRQWIVLLTVPDQGPPSTQLQSTTIAWQVKVDLDVSGRDLHADIDFWVYAPLSAASRAQTPERPFLLDAGKCEFLLHLPSRFFLEGEEIKGSLILAARKSMTASKVVVRLVRRLEFDDSTANDQTVMDERDLTGGESIHLAAGESREFPIWLVVPPDACPSLHAQKSRVRWSIDCAAPHWLSKPSATLPIEVCNFSVP